MRDALAAAVPSVPMLLHEQQRSSADAIYNSLRRGVYDTSRHIPMGLFETDARWPHPSEGRGAGGAGEEQERHVVRASTADQPERRGRGTTAVLNPHAPCDGRGATARGGHHYLRPSSSSAPSSAPAPIAASSLLTARRWASIAFDEDFFRLAIVSEERVAFHRIELLVSLFLGGTVGGRPLGHATMRPMSPSSTEHSHRRPPLDGTRDEAAASGPLRLKLLRFFDSPAPDNDQAHGQDDDISWTPSRSVQHTPTAARASPSSSAGVVQRRAFTLSDVVAEFPSDDAVHSALHDAEMRLALTKAVSWENRIVCVEHEALVREQILFEYNVQIPLIAALGSATFDMLRLWASAIRLCALERSKMDLLEQEASRRHQIEGWCWSCAVLEDEAEGETVQKETASAQEDEGCRPLADGVGWSTAADVSCRRPVQCECCRIDIAVRQLSAVFLPPSPHRTCAFVSIVLNGRRGLDAQYLNACRWQLAAEQDVVLLYAAHEEAVRAIGQEERAVFAKIVAYFEFEAKRVSIEEELAVAAHDYATTAAVAVAPPAPPPFLKSLQPLAARRVRPMTFALFSRLLSLQYVESLQRATLGDAAYWAALLHALEASEADGRCATAASQAHALTHSFGLFVAGGGDAVSTPCALQVVADAECTAWAALKAQFKEATDDVKRRQAKVRRRNTRVLLEHVTDFAFVQWERRRRDQIAFLESQVFLQLGTLSRNILREVVAASSDSLTRTKSMLRLQKANHAALASIAFTHSVQRLHRLEEAARSNLASVEGSEAVVLGRIVNAYHVVVSERLVSLAPNEANERACIAFWKDCILSREAVLMEEADASRLFDVQLVEPRRCGASAFFSKLLLSDLAHTFCTADELRLVWMD